MSDNIKAEPKVRLKVAGQSVNSELLPEELVHSFCKAFEEEKDSIAILSTYAYVFCGLRINDIRDMIVLTDKTGARTASREYVRQKIVSVFTRVKEEHIDRTGNNLIAPSYRARNIDRTEVCFHRYEDILKEDIYLEGSQEEEAEEEQLFNKVSSSRKEKLTEEEIIEGFSDGAPSLDKEQCDNDNRPVDKSSGMVNIRNFIRGLFNREKVVGKGINIHKDV